LLAVSNGGQHPLTGVRGSVVGAVDTEPRAAASGSRHVIQSPALACKYAFARGIQRWSVPAHWRVCVKTGNVSKLKIDSQK